jgi:molybdopterin converting factor small subunit
MTVSVTFYSYFKELTGTSTVEMEVPPGTVLGQLHQRLMERFPRLTEMRKSTLIAVGVEYQGSDYGLNPGDEVSLFPPVQGG